MSKIKILVVDDHQVIVDGLGAIIEQELDLEFAGGTSNGKEAIEFLSFNSVDIILMDINMPIMDGLDCTLYINKHYPKTKIIGLSMNDNPRLVKRMVKNGAFGFLLKKANRDKVINAIKTVHNGGTYFDDELILNFIEFDKSSNQSSFSKLDLLTKRELEIIKEIYTEATTLEIADKMSLSPYTIETHKSNIYSKLEINNTVGLIKWALKNGVIE